MRSSLRLSVIKIFESFTRSEYQDFLRFFYTCASRLENIYFCLYSKSQFYFFMTCILQLLQKQQECEAFQPQNNRFIPLHVTFHLNQAKIGSSSTFSCQNLIKIAYSFQNQNLINSQCRHFSIRYMRCNPQKINNQPIIAIQSAQLNWGIFLFSISKQNYCAKEVSNPARNNLMTFIKWANKYLESVNLFPLVQYLNLGLDDQPNKSRLKFSSSGSGSGAFFSSFLGSGAFLSSFFLSSFFSSLAGLAGAAPPLPPDPTLDWPLVMSLVMDGVLRGLACP